MKLMTSKDLAKRWGLSEGTLRNWRSKLEGPSFMKIGGKVVYKLEDVKRYEKDRMLML